MRMKPVFIIINISVLIFACGNHKQSQPVKIQEELKNVVTLTTEQYHNAGIKTDTLQIKNMASVLKLNGKIDVPPQSMVSISVPLGGYLKSTSLLNGMHVKKGDVLAVMEDAQYIQLQQDYLIAKTQFALLESEYNRQSVLNQNKANSDKVFEQAGANFKTHEILLKSLEEKLILIGINPKKLTVNTISKSINIYSPITGFVSAVNVNIGKYLNPSDVLFELVNPEDIHLALTVFENDINKLSIGQKLFAYTNTNPNKKYSCEIILVSKNLAFNNAAQVHCHFKQYDNTLLPGMFISADIELNAKNTTALPEEAIVRFENKYYVFIAKGQNTFEMLQVKTGHSENGFTEIIGDNLIKTRFVIKGTYNLLMMLKNTSET
jgi:cobalt-zinc-cadmium efflux system membrane fusion protein